jgi:hypothetical protein
MSSSIIFSYSDTLLPLRHLHVIDFRLTMVQVKYRLVNISHAYEPHLRLLASWVYAGTLARNRVHVR